MLPRSIASRQAILNAMTLDIAMGGSTNTVLHLLAVANEAGADFKMDDIDALSRKTPVLCKVAPNSSYHIQDVNRAGGILSIMKELADAGLVDTSVKRADGLTLAEAIDKYAVGGKNFDDEADEPVALGSGRDQESGARFADVVLLGGDTDRAKGCIRDVEHAYVKDGGLAVLKGNIALDGCVVKTAGVDESIFRFRDRPRCSVRRMKPLRVYSATKSYRAMLLS